MAERCDVLACIPIAAETELLNAGVAAWDRAALGGRAPFRLSARPAGGHKVIPAGRRR